MKAFILAAALLAAPVYAQQVQPPAQEAVDPARLALARVTVNAIWPAGTYERMMSGTMSTMMSQMMGPMMDMKPGDLATAAGATGDDASAEAGDKTLGEMMAAEDPYFEERMRRTNEAMMKGMIPIMNKLEPSVREALARVYARKFTIAQLEDLNRFFATPTGKTYGTESIMLMVDPEVIAAIGSLMPEVIKDMPDLMKQVEAATADLPPPPKRDKAAEE